MKKALSIMMVVLICICTMACGSAATSSTEAADTASAGESVSEEPDASSKTAESDDAQQKADEQRDLLAAFNSNPFPESLGSFTTEDLDGNEVTEAYFADADVTIVHIWATYCDPCLEEMENLGKMAESLPDNAKVLGIVADVNSPDAEEKEAAKQIISDNNVKFPSVIANDSFTKLLTSVVGVPTTFIVDSEGNIVAEPIVGSDVIGYKRMAKDYLDTLNQ